ncbi:MAG: penicillin-binding transpeptidase domain-containing protein [Chloroflexota bacterium]
MKKHYWLNLVMILVLLVACSPQNGGDQNTPLPPQVGITPAPNVESSMQVFMDAWMVEDFTSMYSMLTQASRDTIPLEDFSSRIKKALNAMNVASIEYKITSVLTNPLTAQVAYHITYHSSLLGDVQREPLAQLSLENGEWHVLWDDGLILPELQGGNSLQVDYRIPARGDIYDRNGDAIVTQADAISLGIVPVEVDPEQSGLLFYDLEQLTGVKAGTIAAQYENYPENPAYIPVGETTVERFNQRAMSKYSGLWWFDYTARYYFDGGIAPHVVGYTQYISPDNLDAYRRLGYSGSEKVGTSGVEKSGEEYLGGKRGASLYVVAPDGTILSNLAKVDPQPAQSIYLTIDRDFQKNVQDALGAFNGAIVVLERDTGRVLAMASTPGFDPNVFEPDNYNNTTGINDLFNNFNQPLFNRAAQGTFALGSIFKIITMATALETGAFTPESVYDCQYDFTELGASHILHDWTWEKCQEEKAADPQVTTCKVKPSGLLTLPEGLMRSCDPWFFHIGLTLFNNGLGTSISDMAKGFGLGSATGIQQIEESVGAVPIPGDGVEATSLAIGQGNLQVTPLQVATFLAALGNGGTLYRPQVFEKVVNVNGTATLSFTPEKVNSLPVSAENLQVIQDAMISVVKNPRGTAYARFSGLNIPVAGKTSTSETGFSDPHAWFGGYTLANREDKPDIAIIVFVENGGEGSVYAAPIFRRVVESYFYDRPQSVYWWESSVGITRTPTPAVTETPVP